jgi:hypothetical protein
MPLGISEWISNARWESDQQHPQGNQPPFERVQRQSQTFQCCRPQQRLIAFFSNNHGRRAAFAAQFKIGVADPAGDGPAVVQREIHLTVRRDAQRLQCWVGHKTIDHARSNQKIDRCLAQGGVVFFHKQLLIRQAHSKFNLILPASLCQAHLHHARVLSARRRHPY